MNDEQFEERRVDDAEIARVREKLYEATSGSRVPAGVDRVAMEMRNGSSDLQFAIPDGVRPVEINTDEAGWKGHPDAPSYPGKSSVEEYVVDLHSFGNPLDPNGRMEWMRQLQAKIPPPDEDYESRTTGTHVGPDGVEHAHVVGGPLRD